MLGTASGQLTTLVDVGSSTSAVVSDLVEGRTYFFAVTAYDISALESLPSSEVTYTVPSTLPLPVPNPNPQPTATPIPTPAPSPLPVPTPNPQPSATPIPTPAPSPSATPSATPAGTNLLNVSTRAYVQTGENVLIGGLIITGDVPKRVVLRAIGPSLIAAGLSNALRDPTITLYDSKGVEIGFNDNWRSNASVVQATGLAPSNVFEAAIVTILDPGAYTAIVSGVDGSKGVALFELYDLSPANARIANIATRGKVESGDKVMIGGFIIGGAVPSTVVIRAVGPSMATAGVAGVLTDPSLELYNSNGSRIFDNDNWRSGQEQQITASGLAPSDDRECAMIATLQPGSYSAIVRGGGSSTGVALVEVYDLSK